MTQKHARAGRSWVKAWPVVTFAFGALVIGALGLDSDDARAQAKAKAADKKSEYAPKSKGLPQAKSLTAGKKVDAASLARLIDQEVNKRLQVEGAKSSGLCDDAEFIRRAHLDIVGVIPPAAKVTAFLDSKDKDKRIKLIDELLADPRYGNYHAEQWVNMMIPRESNNKKLNSEPLEKWFASKFNSNTPLDKTVYELITATGDITENPPASYFVGNPTVDKITDNVTRTFLGVQLQCAQCHNHPFTDWKQTEYWAMAAFFMKTRASGTPQQAAKKGKSITITENNKAPNKKSLPESAKMVPAKFLQGIEPKLNPADPYRPTLAKWMVSTDNRFFARAMANRLWFNMFGRGLVNPVDDMHEDNAATHPELLATLTEQMKLNGFDAKYMIRAICLSDTYQRSSVSTADAGSVDIDIYSRREIRVMNPEQMYDSLTTILGTSNGKPKAAEKKVKTPKGGLTGRAAFIAFFHVDEANPLEYQNGIPQALRMMNSAFTSRSDVIANQIAGDAKTPAEAIERIFVTALSRRPTAAETQRLTTYVNRPGATTRAAYGDILWALLNSSEFVLNH